MSKRKASWCTVGLIFISAFWFQRHLSNLINWLYQEDFLTDLTARKQIDRKEGVVEDLFCYSTQKRSYLLGEKINQIFHSLKCWHVPAKAKPFPGVNGLLEGAAMGPCREKADSKPRGGWKAAAAGPVPVCKKMLPSMGPSGCALGSSPHSLSSSPAMCGAFHGWPSAMRTLRECKKGTDLGK